MSNSTNQKMKIKKTEKRRKYSIINKQNSLWKIAELKTSFYNRTAFWRHSEMRKRTEMIIAVGSENIWTSISTSKFVVYKVINNLFFD